MENQCGWLPYMEGNEQLQKVLEHNDARGISEARFVDRQGGVIGYQFKAYLNSQVDVSSLHHYDANPEKISYLNIDGNAYQQFRFTINKKGLKPAEFIICSRIQASITPNILPYFNHR